MTDPAPRISTYCLYCLAGKENRVLQALKGMGYSVFSPVEVKRVYREKQQPVMRETRLMPGYVFFELEEGVEPNWEEVRRITAVLKILAYADGARAMRGADLEFIGWLKRMDYKLGISKVVQIGTKIKVMDGPLKHYEGKIVEVKKNRKVVAIELDLVEQKNLIWCPIEYLDVV